MVRSGQIGDDRDFALRIRNLDVVRLERAPDTQIKSRLEVALSVFRVVNPDTELEIDAAFGEPSDQDERRIRLPQHACLAQRNLGHETHGEIEITAVTDLNGHPELDVAARVG